jgi:hypothetical protein
MTAVLAPGRPGGPDEPDQPGPIAPGRLAAALRRCAALARWLWSSASRFPATGCLLVAIAATRIFQHVDPATASRWEWATSTTVSRMLHNPVPVLVGSIPWLPQGPLIPWLALSALAVGGLELALGTATALGVVLTGHVGATVISEGILGLRVAAGQLPSSALHVLDVGPSYVVAAALSAGAFLPGPRRGPRMVMCLALAVATPLLTSGVIRGDLDGVGHTAALVLGVLAARMPAVRRRAVPGRVARRSPDGPDARIPRPLT